MISRRAFFFGAPAVLVLGAHMKIRPPTFSGNYMITDDANWRIKSADEILADVEFMMKEVARLTGVPSRMLLGQASEPYLVEIPSRTIELLLGER